MLGEGIVEGGCEEFFSNHVGVLMLGGFLSEDGKKK